MLPPPLACRACAVPWVQVFFKMDKCGEGEEVQVRDLPLARELAFQGFGHDLFQEVGVGQPRGAWMPGSGGQSREA